MLCIFLFLGYKYISDIVIIIIFYKHMHHIYYGPSKRNLSLWDIPSSY